jgi:hypothetical protein
MARKSKLDKLLELVNTTENPEILELAKQLQEEQNKIKKINTTKKPKKPKKIKEVDEESIAKLPDTISKNDKVGFKKNLFQDTGELCQSDRMFDEKYGKKFKAQERTKPAAIKYKNRCSRCSKEVESFMQEPYYVCPRCAGAR